MFFVVWMVLSYSADCFTMLETSCPAPAMLYATPMPFRKSMAATLLPMKGVAPKAR